jgi:hypothetical protein
MRLPLRIALLGLTALIIGSCENIKGDVMPEDQLVAEPDFYEIPARSSLNFNPMENDRLTGDVNFTIGMPQAGTLVWGNGLSYTYTPHDYFTGVDSISYTLSRGDRMSTSYIKIKVVDTAGCLVVARPDEYVMSEGGMAQIHLLANDDLCDAPAPIITRVAPKHALSYSYAPGGFLNYMPDTTFFGVDTLVYAICRGNQCSEATVRITVEPNIYCQQVFQPQNDYFNFYAQDQNSIVVYTENLLQNDFNCANDINPASFQIVDGEGPKLGNLTGYQNITLVYSGYPNQPFKDSVTYSVASYRFPNIKKTAKVYFEGR